LLETRRILKHGLRDRFKKGLDMHLRKASSWGLILVSVVTFCLVNQASASLKKQMEQDFSAMPPVSIEQMKEFKDLSCEIYLWETKEKRKLRILRLPGRVKRVSPSLFKIVSIYDGDPESLFFATDPNGYLRSVKRPNIYPIRYDLGQLMIKVQDKHGDSILVCEKSNSFLNNSDEDREDITDDSGSEGELDDDQPAQNTWPTQKKGAPARNGSWHDVAFLGH
jgi:hypothetical protein